MASTNSCYLEAMGYIKKKDYMDNTSTASNQSSNQGYQAYLEFSEHNRNRFFIGGVNFCDHCNIIHPHEKCPICESPNYFFDDELLLRIDQLKEAEAIWKEHWEKKVKVAEEEVQTLHKQLNERWTVLKRMESDEEGYLVTIEKLKNQKRLLIKKIKELLSMPHLRHIVFDEERL